MNAKEEGGSSGKGILMESVPGPAVSVIGFPRKRPVESVKKK